MLSCIKSIVILYNFLFWLLGVLILGFSAYLWWDSASYLDLTEVSDFYITPFIVLLVLGAIMTVVGFLGCCGAIRESRCLLGMYFLFCMSMCIVCGALFFWVIQNEEVVKLRIRKDTSKLVKVNYGSGSTNATEQLVDRIQGKFSCCGIVGPADWLSAAYNHGNSSQTSAFERGISAHLPEQGTFRIPTSCCATQNGSASSSVQDYSTNDRSFLNSPYPATSFSSSCTTRVSRLPANANERMLKDIEGLFQTGCIDKFDAFIAEKWQLIILVGGLLIGVQVFALLFACFLCCAISREDEM